MLQLTTHHINICGVFKTEKVMRMFSNNMIFFELANVKVILFRWDRLNITSKSSVYNMSLNAKVL